jgi:hypothetical protein
MRRFVPFVTVVFLLSGVVVLGATFAARAQSDVVERGHPIPNHGEGESVFTNATPELLGDGLVPAYPSLPAALALQRVHIAPGGSIVTPGDDPRVVFLYVERGTRTVRNTVDTVVSRGMQDQEAVPAETEFTMSVGDSYLSPGGAGGELRNVGTEEVSLLASIIVPIPEGTATPGAGTPVP